MPTAFIGRAGTIKLEAEVLLQHWTHESRTKGSMDVFTHCHCPRNSKIFQMQELQTTFFSEAGPDRSEKNDSLQQWTNKTKSSMDEFTH